MEASFAAPIAIASATLAAAGIALYGALSDESQLFGPSLVSPPELNQLALTFDDGPNPRITPQLLELLARHQAAATFFVIGQYAQREPALLREIAAAGHTLGNHTQHHLWLPRHSAGVIREELTACSQTLEDLLGAPVQLFRPPHGARRTAVFRAASDLGMQVTMWNLMVGDWKSRTPEDLATRIERGMAANRRRNRGTNLVLHDGGQHSPAADRSTTLRAVQRVLERLPADIRFVTPPHWSSSPLTS